MWVRRLRCRVEKLCSDFGNEPGSSKRGTKSLFYLRDIDILIQLPDKVMSFPTSVFENYNPNGLFMATIKNICRPVQFSFMLLISQTRYKMKCWLLIQIGGIRSWCNFVVAWSIRRTELVTCSASI